MDINFYSEVMFPVIFLLLLLFGNLGIDYSGSV